MTSLLKILSRVIDSSCELLQKSDADGSFFFSWITESWNEKIAKSEGGSSWVILHMDQIKNLANGNSFWCNLATKEYCIWNFLQFEHQNTRGQQFVRNPWKCQFMDLPRQDLN